MRKKFSKTNLYKIKSINPLFYKRCTKCCDKIKREPMWRFKKRFDDIYYYYLCIECAGTPEEVLEYIEPSKPKVTPSPQKS
jgi:hypothetical protein